MNVGIRAGMSACSSPDEVGDDRVTGETPWHRGLEGAL